MRLRGVGFALAGLVAAGCFLPDVEFDPNAGKAGAGSGGAGQGAVGGTAGKGGSGGSGGEGGMDLSTMIELDCTEYCDVYFDACEGQPANTYDDQLDCFATCTTSGWPLRDPDELNAGGTIECRLSHAKLALVGPQDPHCFHSAEVPSKGVCEVTTP
jgi:hypothetical protein